MKRANDVHGHLAKIGSGCYPACVPEYRFVVLNVIREAKKNTLKITTTNDVCIMTPVALPQALLETLFWCFLTTNDRPELCDLNASESDCDLRGHRPLCE